MWKTIQRNLLVPFIGRAGAVFTTWLVTSGVAQETATQIAGGVVAAALLLSDFFLDYANRKAAK